MDEEDLQEQKEKRKEQVERHPLPTFQTPRREPHRQPWTPRKTPNWDGTSWEAPNWARKRMSSETVRIERLESYDMTPTINKPHHMQIEMTGVNNYSSIDIKLMMDKDPELIGIRECSTLKPHGKEKKKVLMMPLDIWEDVYTSTLLLQDTKLPPAHKDYILASENVMFFTTKVKQAANGTWHMTFSIQNQRSMAGGERMVLIEALDQISGTTQTITFPWLHLPRFNLMAEVINDTIKQRYKGIYGITDKPVFKP